MGTAWASCGRLALRLPIFDSSDNQQREVIHVVAITATISHCSLTQHRVEKHEIRLIRRLQWLH
jgi:hypothetical protein